MEFFGWLASGLPVLTYLPTGLDQFAHHDGRSEEHTSELQAPCNHVCRLLLETKAKCAPRLANPATNPPADRRGIDRRARELDSCRRADAGTGARESRLAIASLQCWRTSRSSG